MTNEEIRIEIAGACGWKKCKREPFIGQFERKDSPGCVFDLESLPNYPNDLNAMHEAEKCLDERQQREYATYLFVLQGADLKRAQRDMDDDEAWWWVCTATTAQRAEAFLRVLGKWRNQ